MNPVHLIALLALAAAVAAIVGSTSEAVSLTIAVVCFTIHKLTLNHVDKRAAARTRRARAVAAMREM